MYGRPDGQPLTETRPYAARTKKGTLRAWMARELLAAHQAGNVQVVIGRASDYFGPRGGAQSMLGDRVIPAALAGKTAAVLGDPDQPHTYTYLPDIGEGLAALGEHPEAPGEVWHLPNDPRTRTTRQLVQVIYRLAGQPKTKLRSTPGTPASSPGRHQSHGPGTARAAVRVPGTLHRRQHQDRHQAGGPRHPAGPGPGRHSGHLPHQPSIVSPPDSGGRCGGSPRSSPGGPPPGQGESTSMDAPNATTSAPVTAAMAGNGHRPVTGRKTTMQAIVQDRYVPDPAPGLQCLWLSPRAG